MQDWTRYAAAAQPHLQATDYRATCVYIRSLYSLCPGPTAHLFNVTRIKKVGSWAWGQGQQQQPKMKPYGAIVLTRNSLESHHHSDMRMGLGASVYNWPTKNSSFPVTAAILALCSQEGCMLTSAILLLCYLHVHSPIFVHSQPSRLELAEKIHMCVHLT